MAKTYQYLPTSISSLIGEVVASVSDNLASESSLEISQVSYKCETWIELIQRLDSESNSPLHKATRYPMIALIRNFDEKISSDNGYISTSLTLVIVTRSEPTWLSEKREEVNYIPILRPIYSEFLECLKAHRQIHGYADTSYTHTKTESFHLGTDSSQGNTKYVLPDCVDGIIVSDLSLQIAPTRGTLPIPPPTATLVYINNVAEAYFEGHGTTSLDVTLSTALYIDTLEVGYGSSPEYTIYYPDTNSSTHISIGIPLTHSVGNSQSGNYIGYISCDDSVRTSILYFYYTISGGRLIAGSTSALFLLGIEDIIPTTYDVYPFNITTRYETNIPLIESHDISIDGGNSQVFRQYSPLSRDTTEIIDVVAEPISSGYRDVVSSISLNNELLENISYYKITI